MAKNKYAAACPKGHAKGLQLRRPADFEVAGASPDGSMLDLASETAPASVDWEADGEPGVTSGVWCPTCDGWYFEEECIHPADDAGNPIIPALGDAKADEEEED